MTYECKICDKVFTEHFSFTRHLKDVHNLTVQAYYDKFLKKEGEGTCKICGKPTKYVGLNKGYRTYCSVKCTTRASNLARKNDPKYTEIKCGICGMAISGNTPGTANNRLVSHLRTEHNVFSVKIYYDSYIRKENEGICPACGKETSFRGLGHGYDKYCSNACQQAYQREQPDSQISKLSRIMNIRGMMKKLSESIKEKYSNFLKNDNKVGWSDIRTDPITHETTKDNKQVSLPEGGSAVIKTEISSSTRQDPFLGTRQTYIPKRESCSMNTNIDEIDEFGNGIDETEWC